MRSIDSKFYKSQEWKRCRDSYAKSKSYLCERCLKAGRYTPGTIVHHKKHLNKANVLNPEIALNFENLELLCQRCHNAEHFESKREIRYEVDQRTGEVKIF